FILTALTLSQVAQLEREASGQRDSPIVAEWRFLHERLDSNLKTAVAPETSRDAFATIILPTVQATFRSVEAEKGYDLTLRLAGPAHFAQWGREANLHDGTQYNAWSWDGKVPFSHPTSEDPVLDDGIIWRTSPPSSCPGAPTSGPNAGCMVGVYLNVRLTDGVNTLQESILFATNAP
ncbi:MAG TPA: hypothetical protein VM582_04080, partial [Candidatus Thermoplasmatota archaeon]|nr:hypothetical protein [Candidatus Thermoplasmatota archaeon]